MNLMATWTNKVGDMLMDFQDCDLGRVAKPFRKAKFSHRFQSYLNLQLSPARAIQEDSPFQQEDN